MKLNIPISLTLLRIAAIPVCIFLYFLPVKWAHFAAAVIFSLAAITDWLDGYLARSWQQQTRFGEFLDPVADKLMVAMMLVVIVGEQGLPFLSLPAAIIVGREILVSALREWMAEIGKRASVAVSVVGKIKTTMQLISLVLLILYTRNMPREIQLVGAIALHLAAGLTLWSMVLYIRAALPEIKAST